MRHGKRSRGLRPVPVAAALGIVLGGCCCGPRYYGDTGRDHYGPMIGPNAPPSSVEYDRALSRNSRTQSSSARH
ncbi:hypothetical protein GCM10009416_13040 [Craurococcus roseus]|uniref:Lipoprotein n=1 Tax=Craurococcus roseus TaxID=77585 RepID=A0ABN1EVN9_9PROT